MHSSIAVIGGPWKIGILDPRNQKILGTVVLNDGEALSTSAQYEQPGHITDPRSGRPAGNCLSVTVITGDAALADALSTAVFVLGPVEGMKLIKKFKAEAVIVDKNGKVYDNFGFKLR
jgi:thiamine biosynthesis lipoprotein